MADESSLNLRHFMHGTTDTLTLTDQNLNDDQVEYLTVNLPPTCRKLHLFGTVLSDIGVAFIAENLLLRGGVGSKLTYLSLGNTSITDEGVKRLCKALSAGNNQLRKLSLDSNTKITSIGARVLAELLEWNNRNGCLEILDMSFTGIGRDGVYALCRSLEGNMKLKVLDVTMTLSSEERNDRQLSDLIHSISNKLGLIVYH